MLRAHGVEPIIVFDGGRLPIKGEEEESRRRWVWYTVVAAVCWGKRSCMGSWTLNAAAVRFGQHSCTTRPKPVCWPSSVQALVLLQKVVLMLSELCAVICVCHAVTRLLFVQGSLRGT